MFKIARRIKPQQVNHHHRRTFMMMNGISKLIKKNNKILLNNNNNNKFNFIRNFHNNIKLNNAREMFPRIEETFGANCFNSRSQRQYLPPKVFKAIQDKVNTHQPIDRELTEQFAAGLHRWATDLGATHFTHWFLPMTSRSASKHDSFMQRSGDHVISTFSGKTLAINEPDGSSFPNGGLRDTSEARGYAVWDPSSPCFVVNHGTGTTLYIPSCFFSWKGSALDEKTPLLRSNEALNREALNLLKTSGDHRHSYVHTDSGTEQEFFLVDKDFVLKRPDIAQTGRTLVGRAPPRGQQLDDQYFTELNERVMELINEAEIEMWRLGIPQTTRHKEVAPGQYEIAPVFSSTVIASDQNVIAMEVLSRIAHKHGMEVLFHEKPFAGLNGSGKHNNWSIGTDLIPTVFAPGNVPQKNQTFMLFLAATIRAVDAYQDLLRVSVASISNDHRLGANEAPPAIVSIYLGEDITDAVDKFLNKDFSPSTFSNKRGLGFSCLPEFDVDSTDRNRTSPFAFTGNKFEFRAVGSGMTVHRSNYVLNSILAESCQFMTNEINKKVNDSTTDAERADIAMDVARDVIKKHYRIIFNGDAYSNEWHKEAEERGLLNLRTTADALAEFDASKNIDLFERTKVLNAEENQARSNVWLEQYITLVQISVDSLSDLLNQRVLPAAHTALEEVSSTVRTAAEFTTNAVPALTERLQSITDHIETIVDTLNQIQTAAEKMHTFDTLKEQAKFGADNVLPLFEKARTASDALEGLCDNNVWSLPTYHEMLYTGQLYDVAPTSD